MKRTRNIYHYAIRKCKRAVESIKKNKLLDACFNDKTNFFEQLRKMRSVKDNLPEKMDGCKNVAEKFANVYQNLYNSVNDNNEMENILKETEMMIDHCSLNDVDLVTTEVIEKAIHEIKTSKNDPVFNFNSDCIKRAPSALSYHLANIIRSFLIHGHVSKILLLATIVPLIKDKLGDREASENYRSIALSSVILKIFDWVILSLFSKLLGLDELQFSYQKYCSTNMCTWLMIESINYYTRNNSNVYTCFMDMKKAFDMVKHSLLFRKLITRNVPPIFIRLIIVMYMSQSAKVRWQDKTSNPFMISNGVKQGAVLSAILFCVYIDDLIKQLRKEQDGCWINGDYVGIIIYADDIVLLAPSIDALQNMIDTCSRYATSHNLSFSTDPNPQKSKTKCIAFGNNKTPMTHLSLNDKPLPWVNYVKHLGTTITNENNDRMNQDLLEKRADYISKNNELMQEFHYAHPNTKILINQTFNTHFYGAPLWDMFGRTFEKLEKTWNVSHRIMLSLPRNTHKYFIEPLSGTSHIIFSLRRRFIGFIRNISTSIKEVLRNMLNVIKYDCRSNTGRNFRKLVLLENNCEEYPDSLIGKPYREMKDTDIWKVNIMKEIIQLKSKDLELNQLSYDELEDISRFVCGT